MWNGACTQISDWADENQSTVWYFNCKKYKQNFFLKWYKHI